MSRIEDAKERLKLTRQLTGPLQTDPRRIALEAARDPSEPPMPNWWTEDEEYNGASTAMQLGRSPR